MKIGLKKVSEDVAENLYEQMPEQELFLRIRDDLLYSRTGIRMDEQVTKKDPEKFLEEVNQYSNQFIEYSPMLKGKSVERVWLKVVEKSYLEAMQNKRLNTEE